MGARQVKEARAVGTLLTAGRIGQVPAPMVSVKGPAQVRAELLRMDLRWACANGYQPA